MGALPKLISDSQALLLPSKVFPEGFTLIFFFSLTPLHTQRKAGAELRRYGQIKHKPNLTTLPRCLIHCHVVSFLTDGPERPREAFDSKL